MSNNIVRVGEDGRYYLDNKKTRLIDQTEIDEDIAKKLIRNGYEIDAAKALLKGIAINDITLYFIMQHASKENELPTQASAAIRLNKYRIPYVDSDKIESYRLLLDVITYFMIIIKLKPMLEDVYVGWNCYDFSHTKYKWCINVTYPYGKHHYTERDETILVDNFYLMNTVARFLKQGKIITEMECSWDTRSKANRLTVYYLSTTEINSNKAINDVNKYMKRIQEELKAV